LFAKRIKEPYRARYLVAEEERNGGSQREREKERERERERDGGREQTNNRRDGRLGRAVGQEISNPEMSASAGGKMESRARRSKIS